MFYVFENPNNYASWVKGDEHLTANQIAEAVVLETLPVEEEIDGFIGLLKCSKAENRVWYEYIEKPETSDTDIERLTQENESLIQRIDLLEGMQLETLSLISTLNGGAV